MIDNEKTPTPVGARHTEATCIRLYPAGGTYADTITYTRADVTEEEAKVLTAADAVESAIYDRLAAARADEKLAAAYEAHPEIGATLEASTMALAKANARLVELGEKPVEIEADPKAESPEKAK